MHVSFLKTVPIYIFQYFFVNTRPSLLSVVFLNPSTSTLLVFSKMHPLTPQKLAVVRKDSQSGYLQNFRVQRVMATLNAPCAKGDLVAILDVEMPRPIPHSAHPQLCALYRKQ